MMFLYVIKKYVKIGFVPVMKCMHVVFNRSLPNMEISA